MFSYSDYQIRLDAVSQQRNSGSKRPNGLKAPPPQSYAEMRSLLLLLLLAASVVGIAGRGSAPIVLNVTHARSTPSNPMKFNNLTLWCSPDNVQVSSTRALFPIF